MREKVTLLCLLPHKSPKLEGRVPSTHSTGSKQKPPLSRDKRVPGLELQPQRSRSTKEATPQVTQGHGA